VYIVAQLLFWSRLSQETYTAIHKVLTHVSRNVLFSPNRTADTWVEKQKIVELFFQNVIDSVYYSYSSWKDGFFTFRDENESTCPMKNNGNQVIHACLLISAIQECSKAFSREWEVNYYPEEVQQKMAITVADFNKILSDKDRDENDGEAQSIIDLHYSPFPSKLTFLVVAHGLHMGAPKPGDTKIIHKARFKAHKERFLSDLSDVTLSGRDPFVRRSDGNWLVSIIGCTNSDQENMYTTRLSDFLAVILQNQSKFDYDEAKELFVTGLIARFLKKFPKTGPAPREAAGSCA
jgi:hypothetical protein